MVDQSMEKTKQLHLYEEKNEQFQKASDEILPIFSHILSKWPLNIK